MGIETLIAKINEKVDAQIAEANDKAKIEADEIISEILASNNAKCNEIISLGQSAADAFLKREALKAELDAKNATLEMKNRVVDSAFEKAKEKLLALSDSDKTALYKKKLENEKPEGEFAIICSSDMASCAKEICNAFGFEKTSQTNGKGVFILSGKDYDIDLSFDALIDECREKYTQQTAEILFTKEN